jgi:hypothetical protein
MRICVAPAYAVRAYKQLLELKKKGYTVVGISDRTTTFRLFCI